MISGNRLRQAIMDAIRDLESSGEMDFHGADRLDSDGEGGILIQCSDGTYELSVKKWE